MTSNAKSVFILFLPFQKFDSKTVWKAFKSLDSTESIMSPKWVQQLARSLSMICVFFRHLHPTKLATCSVVDKRWHSTYAFFRLDRMVASDTFYCDLKGWVPQWEIGDKELCPLKMFSRLVDQSLISNLKQLVLFDNRVSNTPFLKEFDLKRKVFIEKPWKLRLCLKQGPFCTQES